MPMHQEPPEGTGPWSYYLPDEGETRADAREVKGSTDATRPHDVAQAIAAKYHHEEPFEEMCVAVIDAAGSESVWVIDAEPDVTFYASPRRQA
jgi:hypothetical protein